MKSVAGGRVLISVCLCVCLELSHCCPTFPLKVCLRIGDFIKWNIKLSQSKIQFSLGQAIHKVLFWFCSVCGAIRCICSENCRFVAFSPSVLDLKPQTVLKNRQFHKNDAFKIYPHWVSLFWKDGLSILMTNLLEEKSLFDWSSLEWQNSFQSLNLFLCQPLTPLSY